MPAASRHEALEDAINAAESCMRALKLCQDPDEKSQLSARVRHLLETAERIKLSEERRAVDTLTSNECDRNPTFNGAVSSGRMRMNVTRKPHSSRKLPRKEQILLLKASFLNGFKFPPWEGRPDSKEFELSSDGELFIDTHELPLSAEQEDSFDGWKRPFDALPPPSWPVGDGDKVTPSMTSSKKIDLVQDGATDCSVVASLCADISRVERGLPSIIRSVLFPLDDSDDTGRPRMSESGKYVLRLNFNGCHRKVVIDDRLPTTSSNRVVHILDRNSPGLLWPALVEKAYLKVRGGYDFPGSNSATDLWILSGWIPEQVFLESDELEPQRFWERISNGFSYGDILITLGTGPMSSATERDLGLASEHDYALLDLREVDGQKLMLIKNPWCEGPSWKGKLAGVERRSHVKDRTESSQLPTDRDTDFVQNSRDLLNDDAKLSPGTFWMDLNNVMQHFESIYLNWNPDLFAHREDVHFEYDLTPAEYGGHHSRGRYASLRNHPQYTIKAEKGGTIWVLLCRHFRNVVPADATPEEIENDRYGIELSGHIALFAFSSNGRRVLLPDKAIEKGCFVDSPQTLLKLDDCGPGQVFTLVPAEQELPAALHSFTISSFASSPISLAEAVQRHPYTQAVRAAWTKDTAGGNAHSPTYSTNPQFSLLVKRKMSISVLLESDNDELNVHVKLIHGMGQRVHSVNNRDIVVDSKDYRRGCCLAESAELDAGRYTIICSTFDPNQLGTFGLVVESSQETNVELLPKEGAGKIRIELETVGFQAGENCFNAPMVPQRLTRFHVMARYTDMRPETGRGKAPNRSLIRLRVETGRYPHRHLLAASNGGEYSDSAGGIRTDEIDVVPGQYHGGQLWLILDRMQANVEGMEERVKVDLYVDHPEAVACGPWQAWNDK